MDAIAGGLHFIPDMTVNTDFWGLGASTVVFSGDKLAGSIKTSAEILRTVGQWEEALGAMASRKAGYQRRADDWLLQANLAAREPRQIGLQIISSLIAEQVARREYLVAQTQVGQAQETVQFLQTMFSEPEPTLRPGEAGDQRQLTPLERRALAPENILGSHKGGTKPSIVRGRFRRTYEVRFQSADI